MVIDMKCLEEYYNKFNEDKRLNTRRGCVEFTTCMKYIHKYLKTDSRVLDIGAGTGKYSLKLYEEGYDVTAVELVKHNLQIIKSKNNNIKAHLGNALDLSIFKDDSFDLVILFGPMYHLKTREEQIKALMEAKRVTRKDGIILVSYCMNEYAVIEYGFKKNNIINNVRQNQVDSSFHILNNGNELYDYVRIEDINYINRKTNSKRIKIVSADGSASYIRNYLNKLSDEEFNLFLKYHLSICERRELLGASTHVLDIIKK